jgi:hypothetical protein
MNRPVFETTATALREKSKLRRHFRRFDMFFYLICTVVTIDTIGAVASNGDSRPDVERPYRVPGGMAGAWICSVVPAYVPAESPENAL